MQTVDSSERDVKGRRGPLQASVRRSMNEAALQISVLQRRVGARLDLRDVDMECFNVVSTEGPLGPTALAHRIGVHPATMTGVLDRLERGGWVLRERDPANRRAVVVRARDERTGELFGLLSGMNTAMGDVLRRYGVNELAVIADFLERTVVAGQHATEDLASGG